VVRAALRLLERQEAEDDARLEALRHSAKIAIEAFERGEYRTFETFDEMERHLIDQTEPVIPRAANR
jgi:antitoxin ParD1/3/4